MPIAVEVSHAATDKERCVWDGGLGRKGAVPIRQQHLRLVSRVKRQDEIGFAIFIEITCEDGAQESASDLGYDSSAEFPSALIQVGGEGGSVLICKSEVWLAVAVEVSDRELIGSGSACRNNFDGLKF
jgi:hypothetical protein